MKNLFVFTLMIALFAVTGCKKAADETNKAADKAVETTKKAADKVAQKTKEVSNAVSSSLAIPQFENQVVTDYLQDYSQFIGKYETMMAKKSEATGAELEQMKSQFQDMRKEAQDFTKRSIEVTSQLKKDEMSKFNEVFGKLQKRWADANK